MDSSSERSLALSPQHALSSQLGGLCLPKSALVALQYEAHRGLTLLGSQNERLRRAVRRFGKDRLLRSHRRVGARQLFIRLSSGDIRRPQRLILCLLDGWCVPSEQVSDEGGDTAVGQRQSAVLTASREAEPRCESQSRTCVSLCRSIQYHSPPATLHSGRRHARSRLHWAHGLHRTPSLPGSSEQHTAAHPVPPTSSSSISPSSFTHLHPPIPPTSRPPLVPPVVPPL